MFAALSRDVLEWCCVVCLTSVFSLQIMDVLCINDPDSRPWLRAQLPPLRVLVGDCIARDSGLRSRFPQHRFHRHVRGGATWRSVASDLPDVMSLWTEAAEEQGRRRGSAVLWLTGNDVYSKRTLLPSFSNESLEEVAASAAFVAKQLLAVAERVVVLGPLPRPSGDLMGQKWEVTAAFHLERRLRHHLPAGVQLIPLGRQLTKKSAGRHCLTSDCLGWFRPDGTHLTQAGYDKLEDALSFPIWLTMSGQ